MPNPSAEARDLVNQIAPPVGSIIAWHPRLFSAAGNVGVDTADRVTLAACYEYADGSIITAQDSPLKNGAYERKPDLTDNRFTMGGSSVTFNGDNYVYGGTNHAGPPLSGSNNGDNSITIAEANLPLHTHAPGTLSISASTGNDTPDHGHSSYYPGEVVHGIGGGGPVAVASNIAGTYAGTTGANTRHTHPLSISSGSFFGATADGGFANNVINVLPKYLIVKYIMRVK